MGRGNPTRAGRSAPLSAGGPGGSVVHMKPRKWITISLAAAAAAAVTATATTTTASAATVATTPARQAYTQQDLQRDLDAITATGVPGVLAGARHRR